MQLVESISFEEKMSKAKIDKDDADNDVDNNDGDGSDGDANNIRWNGCEQIAFERDIMQSSETTAQFCAAYLPPTMKKRKCCVVCSAII